MIECRGVGPGIELETLMCVGSDPTTEPPLIHIVGWTDLLDIISYRKLYDRVQSIGPGIELETLMCVGSDPTTELLCGPHFSLNRSLGYN